MRSRTILLAPLFLAALGTPSQAVDLSSSIALTGFVEGRLDWNDGPRGWQRAAWEKLALAVTAACQLGR